MSTTTFRRGAAALAVGVLSLGGAAAAQAATLHSTYPGTPENNQAGAWVDDVEVLGFTDVSCSKIDRGMDVFTADMDYAAVIVKAGAGDAANELYVDVAAGDTIAMSGGKQISHVIVCTGTPVEDEPQTPGTPEEPETPGTPEEPGTPGEPETPGTPEEPETPGTPEEPGDDAGTPIGPIVQTDAPTKGVNPAVAAGLGALALAGAGTAAVGARRRTQN